MTRFKLVLDIVHTNILKFHEDSMENETPTVYSGFFLIFDLEP